MSTINIQFASDLHIEFKNDEIPDPLKYIIPSSNILVLAGDIGSFYKIQQLHGFLERLCPLFEIVIYVPGNHEYYTVQNLKALPMSKLLDKLYEIEKTIKNLYILNQTSVIIGDVCITGCTLWSETKVSIPKFIVRIYGMTDEIYNKKFINDVKYINKMIDYCKEQQLKLVVVTHHCPTYKILDNNKMRDRYVSLYASNLDNMLSKEKIHTWICGHIHKNFNIITEDGTRVVGNQYGKPKDKITDYNKNLVIEI